MASAEIDFGGVKKRCQMACVPEATEGDYVLVHAGIALTIIDRVEAERVLATLTEIGHHETLDSPQTNRWPMLVQDFQLDIHSFAGRHARTVCVTPHQAAGDVSVSDEQDSFRKFVLLGRCDGDFDNLPLLTR